MNFYRCNKCNFLKGCCNCNCGFFCCAPGPVGPQGPPGPPGPPCEGAGNTIIPFSISKYGTDLQTDEQGNPSVIAFSGFGNGGYELRQYLFEGEWESGIIVFNEERPQYSSSRYPTSFIMPHDGILNNIHVLFSSNYSSFEEYSIIWPFVCIAVSRDGNEYIIYKDTITYTEPYTGGIQIPVLTNRKGFTANLDIEIPEGSIIGIMAGIAAENITHQQSGSFWVSGGLSFK